MTLTKYKKALDSKEVLTGVVKMIYFDKERETDVLLLDLNDAKGIITRDEVDADLEWKSLINFVGREIQYVVKEVDAANNTVIASRKDAQVLLRDATINRLQEGEVMTAKVVNHLRYGVYLDIQGVTGLLKNQDFASDHTAAKDVLRIGDSVNVKLKKLTDSRLLFEAVEKYKNPTIFDFDLFERNQVVLGTVVNVQPWGAFIRIGPNIDALCSLPGTGELEEGIRVRFRITKVNEEDQKIRGKIVEII